MEKCEFKRKVEYDGHKCVVPEIRPRGLHRTHRMIRQQLAHESLILVHGFGE